MISNYNKGFNIAFFASHGGSNMQSIIDAIKSGTLRSNASFVISNNSDSGALNRARNENIPCYHISSKTHPIEQNRTEYILSLVDEYRINLIVLAGYMKKLPIEIINKVNGRVLNIHPALLPKFGGENMFGMNVHKAVIDSGESVSGATVHLVDSEYDRGRILLQREVPVLENDTAVNLADRVLNVEHQIYQDVILQLEKGQIII